MKNSLIVTTILVLALQAELSHQDGAISAAADHQQAQEKQAAHNQIKQASLASPEQQQQQQQQNVNASTNSPPTARLLASGSGNGGSKPSAPYAIDDSSQPGTAQAAAGGVKNFIFRLLALNQTAFGESGEQSWSLSGAQEMAAALEAPGDGPGGAEGGQTSELELRSFLESLDRNNITSEVRFDEYSPGVLNITISNLRNLTRDGGGGGGQANKLFVEQLLEGADESRYVQTFNVSAVMRDSHRFMGRHPTLHRSRLSSSQAGSAAFETSASAGLAVAPPPLRRTVDVVAENYTARKIADEANIFALKLVHQLNLERLGAENVIQSPFAIYQGLALLLSGAMGDTSRELDRALLSVQSVYENTRLTHDQDRARLMASFGDVVRQLQAHATSHFAPAASGQAGGANCTAHAIGESSGALEQAGALCAAAMLNRGTSEGNPLLERMDALQYRGGSEQQHFIVANNLLFSPGAYEISSEFKATLNAYYNNTALTKMEVGSTESVQVVNGWIRHATAGLIPSIMSKRGTFDEFNVMTLLSTSWLAQEWLSSFRRVASSLRSSIRLKGQTIGGGGIGGLRGARREPTDEPLLEFVDDQKASHFVDYVRSEPTRHIHNYHTILNKQWVDIVVVPFRDSNQRLITITPMAAPTNSPGAAAAAAAPVPGAVGLSYPSPLANLTETLNTELLLNQDASASSTPSSTSGGTVQMPAETSALSKLLAALALDPRRAMRSLWATIAPDLITKQTMLSMQLASGTRQKANATAGEHDERLALRNLMIPPKTQLSMPLFRIDADASISAALNHVGLVNAFDPAQANFIGINGHPFNYNKLHLSNVIYKTTFNLNEDGINYDRTIRTLEPMRVLPQRRQRLKAQEAPLEPGELVNDVKLNKPFMFLIADTKSKLVLYTGLVRNPASENSPSSS